jgi:hypothetical protein
MTIDKQKKKELSAAYTQSVHPYGIYQIRNTVNGKVWVDSTMNLEGARNRVEFQRQTNMNSIPHLRDDWSRFGGESFVFEELDRLNPGEDDANDKQTARKYRDELDVLLQLWLDKLQPYGDKGYNVPKR